MNVIADPRFLECLPHVLLQECPLPSDWSNLRNFSNDARDPGGKTMCGIIQREYDAYRKRHGLPVRDVRSLTQNEGEDIYFNSYWLPHCPQLPRGLDLSFMDECVNAGPFEAIKILQRALKIGADGIWGDETKNAVASITDLSAVINSFANTRLAVYRQMRGWQYFAHSWTARTASIKTSSVAMVA